MPVHLLSCPGPGPSGGGSPLSSATTPAAHRHVGISEGQVRPQHRARGPRARVSSRPPSGLEAAGHGASVTWVSVPHPAASGPSTLPPRLCPLLLKAPICVAPLCTGRCAEAAVWTRGLLFPLPAPSLFSALPAPDLERVGGGSAPPAARQVSEAPAAPWCLEGGAHQGRHAGQELSRAPWPLQELRPGAPGLGVGSRGEERVEACGEGCGQWPGQWGA